MAISALCSEIQRRRIVRLTSSIANALCVELKWTTSALGFSGTSDDTEADTLYLEGRYGSNELLPLDASPPRAGEAEGEGSDALRTGSRMDRLIRPIGLMEGAV